MSLYTLPDIDETLETFLTNFSTSARASRNNYLKEVYDKRFVCWPGRISAKGASSFTFDVQLDSSHFQPISVHCVHENIVPETIMPGETIQLLPLQVFVDGILHSSFSFPSLTFLRRFILFCLCITAPSCSSTQTHSFLLSVYIASASIGNIFSMSHFIPLIFPLCF